MFTNANLSFDAAPPIKVVLRFFLSGAFFGIVASVFALLNIDFLNNLSSSKTLAIVHLFVLGVMLSFMLGALFQMLPVIAGVSINRPELISMRVNHALNFGLIMLVLSFFNGNTILYLLAALFLGFALFASIFIMIKALINVDKSSSGKGMMLAIISLGVTALLGLLMLSIRGGVLIPFDYLSIKNIHFSFGLFGWIALLIISVAYQVIEMFYVTPPYPKTIQKYLTFIIFTLVALLFIFPNQVAIIDTIVSILIAVFAIFTLIRLSQKKRSVSDATIWFWRFGATLLILFATLLLLSNFIDIKISLIAIFYTFFALSIISAMLFKIVPFLVWFQLNRAGYFDGPMMHEVIHPKIAKYSFYLFAFSFVSIAIGFFATPFAYLGALLLIFYFITILTLVYNAWHKYLFTLQNGTKIDFPSVI